MIHSWTFEAQAASWSSPVMSSGRWDDMEQAAKAAADFLVYKASTEPEAWQVRVCFITELELDNA